MKTLRILILLLPVLLWADEPAHRFLLVAPLNMADAPVERVQGWMASNLHYPVEVIRLPDWGGETAAEQAEALAELPREGVIVTVVMSTRLEEAKHAVILPERMLGVMNVAVLLEGGEERDLRRLDRQAIRIVGFALGVPPQPIPFCALAPYRTTAELDQIGRGFSPPAMAQYRAALVERNIPLSPEAERHLPDVRVRVPAPPPRPED